ncbi:hypothetical protein [Mobilibacterium timonense]|uniref:hypothetical protein n=1 Tax=Mobilibacterium timonense TaxID=1871012 RepID=UPI00098751B9|nr:hypothetical protein [Mobilibacterium timonense]
MLKGLISTVNGRISFLEMLLEELVNELSTAPPGKIKAVRNKGVVQCYHRISPSEKTGRYIRGSQKKLIQALIHKRLFTQMLNAAAKELKMLKKLKDFYDSCCTVENVPLSLPPCIRELLKDSLMTNEEACELWASQNYKGNDYFKENKRFFSSNFSSVRSKSEYIIAMILVRYGIPFFYEKPLRIVNDDFSKVIYPDITIWDVESRQEIYWEHFGMMDDPDYALKAIKRIMEYQRSGIYIGERLIITFESSNSPLDTKHVERISKRLNSGIQMLKAEPPCISCPPGFGIWPASSDAIHTET